MIENALTLEETVHRNLCQLLKRDLVGFLELVESVRTKEGIQSNVSSMSTALSTLLIRKEVDQKTQLRAAPPVAEVIEKYVEGEGLELTIKPFRTKEL